MRSARRSVERYPSDLVLPGGAGVRCVAGEWKLVGNRYEDPANSKLMGGYGLVNLFADYRLQPGWVLFARANNIFDKYYETADNYATAGANVFIGVRYSPQ